MNDSSYQPIKQTKHLIWLITFTLVILIALGILFVSVVIFFKANHILPRMASCIIVPAMLFLAAVGIRDFSKNYALYFGDVLWDEESGSISLVYATKRGTTLFRERLHSRHITEIKVKLLERKGDCLLEIKHIDGVVQGVGRFISKEKLNELALQLEVLKKCAMREPNKAKEGR